MKILAPVSALGWIAGVMGAEKSFRANPIIGSPRLNRMGLHRRRVAVAARMAALRRRMMAASIPAEDRAAYDRDGFVVKPDYLPDETFAAIRDELSRPLPAREMRQGQTVTRMIPLTGALRRRAPAALAAVRDPALNRLTGYVAGRSGAPVHFAQTVIAEPARGPADPQTALHADTFHSTAKFWLFLHDVGEDDGPFVFVPGSHRLTPERLDWEHRQSLSARDDPRAHHALGSFRIGADEVEALGYAAPRRMPVKANTLVVADTHGFHRRAPSTRPTIRVELHGHLRRAPFAPWNGLDPQSLPGVKGEQLALYLAWLDWRERRLGRASIWKDVGEAAADAPASI